MFEVGNFVAKKSDKTFYEMSQKERREYLNSIKLLYKWDVNKGYYLVNGEKLWLSDCEYTKILNTCGESKLQTISENKYKSIEHRYKYLYRTGIDVAKIKFKGRYFSVEGYIKDNMLYFIAFGRYYKTKVYLTKDGIWRSC